MVSSSVSATVSISISSDSNYNADENAAIINGSTDAGLDLQDTSKASEITKHHGEKSIEPTNIGIVIFAIVVILALLYGYKRNLKEE